MATREYGERNADGSVTVWQVNDAGQYRPLRTEPWAVNQAQPAAPAPPPPQPAASAFIPAQQYVAPAPTGGFQTVYGGKTYSFSSQSEAERKFNELAGLTNTTAAQTYQTQNGMLTVAQMLEGLDRAAGGRWTGDRSNPQAVQAAYVNAPRGGTGAGGSPNDLINALLGSNREKFAWEQETYGRTQEFQRQQQQAVLEAERQRQAERLAAEQSRQAETLGQQRELEGQRLWSQMAQALLAGAASLRGPRDYFKFNEYTSGGRNALEQLTSQIPRPAFSAPTGQLQPVNIQDVLTRLGLVQGQQQPTQQVAAVPNPNQVYPGSWDAMGPLGRDLALAAAENQKGWDPAEYERQINATRPQGYAPRTTQTNWGPILGIYG